LTVECSGDTITECALRFWAKSLTSRPSQLGPEFVEIGRLRKIYGPGRWRKRKGIARVRLMDGTIHSAEIHWYEAAGIGRKEYKIKYLL
jgi:hypothetical protein